MAEAVIHGDGNAPNLLTDLRDIGRFVARIVADDRTLNRYVYTWSDVLSENEIFDLVEEVSGEKIERKYVRYLSLPVLHSQSRHNFHVREDIKCAYFVVRAGNRAADRETVRRCSSCSFS